MTRTLASASKSLMLSLLATGLLVGGAMAGPIGDFNGKLDAAYADYRMALFATNQGNADKSLKTIAAFSKKWGALAAEYRKAPPPQFSEDPAWASTLDSVAAIADKAAEDAQKNALGEAHEVLEKIRDELSELRHRNGVITFSDRVNAYHLEMEHLLKMADAKKMADPQKVHEVGGKLAVLRYLAINMGDNAPDRLADKPIFRQGLKTVFESIDKAEAAAGSGDAAALAKALKALKPAYAKFFVKFG